MDWSIDAEREKLRDSLRGKEREIANLPSKLLNKLLDEFLEQASISQYSNSCFVDFLAENYPARLAALLEMPPCR